MDAKTASFMVTWMSPNDRIIAPSMEAAYMELSGRPNSSAVLPDLLDVIGMKGWELVAHTRYSLDAGPVTDLWFKRRK